MFTGQLLGQSLPIFQNTLSAHTADETIYKLNYQARYYFVSCGLKYPINELTIYKHAKEDFRSSNYQRNCNSVIQFRSSYAGLTLVLFSFCGRQNGGGGGGGRERETDFTNVLVSVFKMSSTGY